MNELCELLDNKQYDQVFHLITHMARAISFGFMKRCLMFHLVKNMKKNNNKEYFDIVLDIMVYFLYDYRYRARGDWTKLYYRFDLEKLESGYLGYGWFLIRDEILSTYNLETYKYNEKLII